MQESKINALDKSNRAAARPGGFRGGADKTGREASRNKKLGSKRRAHEQNPPRSSGVPKTGPATIEQPVSPASRRPRRKYIPHKPRRPLLPGLVQQGSCAGYRGTQLSGFGSCFFTAFRTSASFELQTPPL